MTATACTEGLKHDLFRVNGSKRRVSDLFWQMNKDGGDVIPPGKKSLVYCGLVKMLHADEQLCFSHFKREKKGKKKKTSQFCQGCRHNPFNVVVGRRENVKKKIKKKE